MSIFSTIYDYAAAAISAVRASNISGKLLAPAPAPAPASAVSPRAMLIGAGVAGVTVAGIAAYKFVSQRRARAQQEAIDQLATKVSEDVFNAIHQNPRLVAVVNGMDDAALGVLNRFNSKLAARFAKNQIDVFATAKKKAELLTKLAEKKGIALLETAPQTKAQADAARAPVVSAEAAPAEAAPARSWVPGFGFARSAAGRFGSTVSTAANAVWSRVPSLRGSASVTE